MGGRRFIADVRRLPRYTGHSAEVRPSAFLTHAGVQREISLITENALAVAQRVGGGPVEIMIGCDHGRHRSVTVARAVVRRLAAGGFVVTGPGSPAGGSSAKLETADSDLSDADTDQEIAQEPRRRGRKRAQIRSRSVRLHDDALSQWHAEPGSDYDQLVGDVEGEENYLRRRLRVRPLPDDVNSAALAGRHSYVEVRPDALPAFAVRLGAALSAKPGTCATLSVPVSTDSAWWAALMSLGARVLARFPATQAGRAGEIGITSALLRVGEPVRQLPEVSGLSEEAIYALRD